MDGEKNKDYSNSDLGYEDNTAGKGQPQFGNAGGNKPRQDGVSDTDKLNAGDHLSDNNGQCNPHYGRD